MKKETNKDGLTKAMEDIRSGNVFDVPEDYFENLTSRLFNEDGTFLPVRHHPGKLRELRPWLIAASLVLMVTMTWWYFNGWTGDTEINITEASLHEYIQSQIMEYDVKTLAGNLSEADIDAGFYNHPDVDIELFENYIQENIEDFETMLY